MWDLSSLTRDRTHAPCGGNPLDHQTTREAPTEFFKVALSMVLQAKDHLWLWLRGQGVQLGQLGVHSWLWHFLSQTPESITSSL